MVPFWKLERAPSQQLYGRHHADGAKPPHPEWFFCKQCAKRAASRGFQISVQLLAPAPQHGLARARNTTAIARGFCTVAIHRIHALTLRAERWQQDPLSCSFWVLSREKG
jgi:hypothetical protein